jgi:hypothetical protein
VLATSGATCTVPFKLDRRPGRAHADDLPIATGAQATRRAATRPLTLGLRDPAHTLAFARSAGLLSELDLLDQLPGFLKPNLNDLGPNGTITSPSTDLQGHLTARFEPPDPGDWSSKLGRIDTLAGLAASRCSTG